MCFYIIDVLDIQYSLEFLCQLGLKAPSKWINWTDWIVNYISVIVLFNDMFCANGAYFLGKIWYSTLSHHVLHQIDRRTNHQILIRNLLWYIRNDFFDKILEFKKKFHPTSTDCHWRERIALNGSRGNLHGRIIFTGKLGGRRWC